MGVVRIVDDKGAPQPITVLHGQVGMVPEGTSLVDRVKVVDERVSRRNWALVDKSRSIGPVCARLEKAMPML